MEREQKSLTNKGFSLVELIIVVAIMAVLVGVLAPQYLRYVEKARLQKDNSAIAEVANVIKIAGAEEDVVEEIKNATADIVYTFDSTGLHSAGIDANTHTLLDKEIIATIKPGDAKMTSTTYTTATATDIPTLTVTIDTTTSIITVKASGWFEKPNVGPGTKDF